MNQSLVFWIICLLLIIGCQSDTAKKNNSNDSVVPTTSPVETPAPVAPPPAGTTVATTVEDEVPAVPPSQTDKKSEVSTPTKPASPPSAGSNSEKKEDIEAGETQDYISSQENSGKVKINIETGEIIPSDPVEQPDPPVTPTPPKVENPVVDPPTATTPVSNPPVVESPKAETPTVETPKPATLAFNHDIFDGLLKKYVSSKGVVDYIGLKREEAVLLKYCRLLEAQTLDEKWSRDEKLAFWINAYNAYTIQMILKKYPIKSIMDLDGGKVWDRKFILLDGKTLSLNNIENDIIRPQFKDPRIHFAVNCAAKSCPPLLNQTFVPQRLNQQLESQTKAFINDVDYNLIEKNKVKVSKIFEWYQVDFANLVEYLNRYSSVRIEEGTKVEFEEYDWGLNE